jgi:dTDP-4-amino-4,6-dideoxygalactose transaminase
MSFSPLFEFESRLAEYTGAPYAVVTDCCTHAIELCLRYDAVRRTRFTAFTYLSVPQLMHRLDISYGLTDETWQGEYQFHNTRIWDSARRLEPGMYRSGQLQCLSFGHSKPMHLGRCGAVLTDDHRAYQWLSQARSDGRDLAVSPWIDQKTFGVGWHYCPTIEICQLGLEKLPITKPQSQRVTYPDCREIIIK